MIVDRIENAKQYHPLHVRLSEALDYLCTTDFSTKTPDRYDVTGDAVYALVMTYEPKPYVEGKGVWEAHQRYYDIQYVVEGAERMGYAPQTTLTVTQEYDADKDCLLLQGEGSFLTVRAGMFVIFGPDDAHMPGVALSDPQDPCKSLPGQVKKVVVKMLV